MAAGVVQPRRQMKLRRCGNLLAAVAASYFLAAGPFDADAATPADVLGTLSTQGHVGTGVDVLISGFIITGSTPKRVLVRGLGPSLGASARLADPTLQLHAGGDLIFSNDNWRDSQEADIQASGHAPSSDAESGIIATLPPSSYTVVLRGVNNGTGVGKIDIIDIDTTTSARLVNMSARALVAAGENVLVGGFVINGPQSRKVIIRGIGPSFASQIAGAMSNPTLQLRDSSGNLLVFNDNWEDTERDAIAETGVPPTQSRESAIVVILAPGSYSAELIGTCGGGGVALVEIYDLGAANASAPLPASSSTPTCYTTWVVDRELTGAEAARTADLDGDGIPNLLEYALGKNPKVADSGATTSGTVEFDGQKYLSLSFTLPTGDDAPDELNYTIERATSLAPANWSSSSTNFVTHSITPGPGELQTIMIRSTRPIGSILREFLRLKVTSTAP